MPVAESLIPCYFFASRHIYLQHPAITALVHCHFHFCQCFESLLHNHHLAWLATTVIIKPFNSSDYFSQGPQLVFNETSELNDIYLRVMRKQYWYYQTRRQTHLQLSFFISPELSIHHSLLVIAHPSSFLGTASAFRRN